MKIANKINKKELRVRGKIRRVSPLPRLSVFRSNRYIYAQIIDDSKNKTVAGITSKDIEGDLTRLQKARKLGIELAKKALEKHIKRIVFDKGVYAYHGIIKEVALGAREGGLVF